MNLHLDLVTQTLIDGLNAINKLFFPFSTEIREYGIDLYTTDTYVKNHMFDFIDIFADYFFSLITIMFKLVLNTSKKLTDQIFGHENEGIAIHGINALIGDKGHYEYEIVNKISKILNSLVPFKRSSLIETLSKIPGGLDVPKDVIAGNLGFQVDGNKTANFKDMNVILDENILKSMQVMGPDYDKGFLYMSEPWYYRFYKSDLFKWFQNEVIKTVNLKDDLDLSRLEILDVLDDVWYNPIYEWGGMGYSIVGRRPLHDMYFGTEYDDITQMGTDLKMSVKSLGGIMKNREFDALNYPRNIFPFFLSPFFSTELKAFFNIYQNIHECHKPLMINNEFYMEGFENNILAHYDIVLLPDYMSRFLQVRFNIVNNDKIVQIKFIVIGLLKMYEILIGFRFVVFWLVGINPYQNFLTSLVVTSVDWIETILGAYVPSLYGIPLTLPLFMAMLNNLFETLFNLTFTFPYLPSEASIHYIYASSVLNNFAPLRDILDVWDRYTMDKLMRISSEYANYMPSYGNECRPFFQFEGLPKLWVENGIPDQMRFSWFWKHPLIFKKYYQDFEVSRIESNVQFLPDIILKDLNLHDLNLNDLQKLNTKELYSFLLENLSQDLKIDLVNLLFTESNANHIDVSDFLDPARLEIYFEILKKVFNIN